MTAYLAGSGPRAFAHRGWHIGDLAGCENTMAAFARAVDEGYRYIETDVHATSDGVLVAFHDFRLDRVTDGRGVISDLTWDQIRTALIGGREPIPLMADVLAAFPDTRFNIDPKTDRAVGPLIDLLVSAKALDRVGLGSFSDRRLATLRRALGPGVVTSLGPAGVALLAGASSLHVRAKTTAAATAQVPVRYGPAKVVTASFIRTAHAAGLEVHVWTIDRPEEMRRLLDLGVDGIMTDRPDVLRAVLVQRGEWEQR